MRTPLHIAAVVALGSALFVPAACSKSETPAATASSSIASVTGAGGGTGCHGHFPDGFCVPNGPNEESCACADCATLAKCGAGCTNDGTCDAEAGEDCSCEDCFHKVTMGSCDPQVNGCDSDDMVCTFTESCLCPDCTATDFCQQNCVDNGECLSWSEGCSCNDCKPEEECGGGAATTTTNSSANGTGGAGGASGTGGAGGMSGAGGSTATGTGGSTSSGM